jgi:hypothetical protein
MNAKDLRKRARETRAKVAAADAKILAAMTPQERQVYQSEQTHAERLRASAGDRNRRYEGEIGE